LTSIITGEDLQNILSKDFSILHQLRNLNKGFPPLSYGFYPEMDALYINMLVSDLPASPIWKKIEFVANKVTQDK
jgi:hypothetical protein